MGPFLRLYRSQGLVSLTEKSVPLRRLVFLAFPGSGTNELPFVSRLEDCGSGYIAALLPPPPCHFVNLSGTFLGELPLASKSTAAAWSTKNPVILRYLTCNIMGESAHLLAER